MRFLTNSYITALNGIAPGQVEYTTPGTYSWTAPEGVEYVSVVCIGGGGAGGAMCQNQTLPFRMAGGGGGGTGWKNNIPVTPGVSYTVVVGAGQSSVSANVSPNVYPGRHTTGNSYFISLSTVAGFGGSGPTSAASANSVGGGFVGDGGGNGGGASSTNSPSSANSGVWGGGGAGGMIATGGAPGVQGRSWPYPGGETFGGSAGGQSDGSGNNILLPEGTIYGGAAGGGGSSGVDNGPSSRGGGGGGQSLYTIVGGSGGSAIYTIGGVKSGTVSGGSSYTGGGGHSGTATAFTVAGGYGGNYGGGGAAVRKGPGVVGGLPVVSGYGAGGAVRIIWAGTRPGDVSRSFPETNLSNL
jgi:hypothetical protein